MRAVQIAMLIEAHILFAPRLDLTPVVNFVIQRLVRKFSSCTCALKKKKKKAKTEFPCHITPNLNILTIYLVTRTICMFAVIALIVTITMFFIQCTNAVNFEGQMQKNIQYINIRIFIIHPLLVRIHISDAEVVFLQQVKVVTDEVKQVLSLRIPLRESEGE